MERAWDGPGDSHWLRRHCGGSSASGDYFGRRWTRDRVGRPGRLAVLLGPFERVEAETARILERAGGRPGHLFNLGHGVLPSTDPDSLGRLVELVHERTATVAA